LLGELPAEKQEQIEELLLTDEESYGELLIVEDELVDDYLRDKLSVEEQKNFRQHFLSTPERYEKLRVGRAFKRYLDDRAAETASDTKPASWWHTFLAHLRFPQTSMALPAVLILISLALVAFWITKNVRRQPTESAREEAHTPTQMSPPPSTPPNQNTQEAKETGHPPAQMGGQNAPNINAAREPRHERVLRDATPRSSTLAVTLIPGMLRSGVATKDVNLPPDIKRLQLTLNLTADDYRRYRAVLQTAAERDVLSKSDLKRSNTRQGPVVTFTVPAKLLSSGDYILTLSGATPDNTFETAGKYYFKLNKN
jgi:hypothetical protein